MRQPRRQEEPLSRLELHRLAAELERRGPREHDDPLVLGLQVVGRRLEPPAQDLLDDRISEGEDLLRELADGGRLGRVAKPTAEVRAQFVTARR